MTVKRVDATQVSGLTWLMVLFFVPRGFSPGTLSTDITTSIFSLLLLLLSHRFALFIYYYFLIFCAQYISNLPSICHHSICTNNNLQQTTTITKKHYFPHSMLVTRLRHMARWNSTRPEVKLVSVA